MDALRKAEESKKQSEQEKKATSSAEVALPAAELSSSEAVRGAESLGQNSLPSGLEAGPALSESEVAEESLTDDDIQLDFENSDAVAASSQVDGLESAADVSVTHSSLELDSFELEPKLPTAARAQSYSADQLQISVPVDDVSSVEPKQIPSDSLDEDYTSISSFLSSAKLDQAVSIASAELEKKKPDAAVDKKVNSTSKAAMDAPLEKAEPAVESIVERTAGSRKSAKSVFAAKKLSQNGNRTLLISVAGIAVVVVIGLGFYLTASLAPSDGISVGADSFPVSQSVDNSSSISDLVAQEESSALQAVTEDASLDSTATLSTQSDTLFGGSAGAAGVADNSAVIVSDQPVGLETANPVLVDSSLVNQQASPEAFADNATDASASLSSVIVDEPVDEVFLIGDLETGSGVALDSSSNTLSSSSLVVSSSSSSNSSSINVPASNDRAAADTGGSLGSASNTVSPAALAESALISFRRTSQQQAVVPALTEGFRAYQNGNWDLARDLYEQTLLDAPENIDALLGLAAIASSGQELSLAMSLYSRVLGLDPSNTLAKTAIRSLAPLGTPAEQERELRKLDAQSPNVASLAFTLGNFYASQSRWSDSQRYYFKALRLAKLDSQSGSSVSPDYAFNLAVSLERLNQAGPALSFYEEALVLATRFPSDFDLSIAKARIENLSRTYSP